MALSNRQKTTPVPPELQPYYDGNKGRGWLRWLIRILVVVALVVVIIFGILWLAHRHDTSNKSAKSPSTSQTEKQKAPSQSSNKSESTNGDSSSTSSDANTSSDTESSSSTATPTSSTQSASIPNTGPGDTVALFIGVTLIGTLLYQIRLRLKSVDY